MSDADHFPELNNSLGPDWYLGLWSTVIGQALLIPAQLVARRVHESNISLAHVRKSSLLTVSPELRLRMLDEAENAHRSSVEHPVLSARLSDQQQTSLQDMANFFLQRNQFAQQPTLRKASRLLRALRLYYRSAGTYRHAVRMWIADLLYAYKINWNLGRNS